MSLQLAAQHMASKGRGPDTTLVHMAPQEVSGLQALARAHGGSLTTNPDTGLPEAGFLSKILPMVLGAALAPMTAGTSLAFLGATPLASALTVGAGYGLGTGSLKKGLLAGLGAYGGASLMGGLSAAGTAAAGGEGLAGAAGTGALDAGMGAYPSAGGIGAGVEVGAPIIDGPNLSQITAPASSASSPINGLTFGPEGTVAANASPINAASIAPTVTPAPQPQTDFLSGMDRAAMENKAVSGFNTANTDSLTNMKRGLSGLMDNQASRDAFMTKMGGGAGLLKTGMMAAAPALLGGDQKQDEYKGSGPNPYEYSYDYRTGSYTRQAPGYRDVQTVTPPRAMADGGPVQEMSDRNEAQTLMANRGQMFAGGGGITALARGGQSHLGDYSDGGRLLKGPGDGVSDSIPATIANKRPARLADGEFVVPARIVSELGNGSTEAGARKLYAMMDRVQKARKKSIGKNRVAVNSRTEKLLPA